MGHALSLEHQRTRELKSTFSPNELQNLEQVFNALQTPGSDSLWPFLSTAQRGILRHFLIEFKNENSWSFLFERFMDDGVQSILMQIKAQSGRPAPESSFWEAMHALLRSPVPSEIHVYLLIFCFGLTLHDPGQMCCRSILTALLLHEFRMISEGKPGYQEDDATLCRQMNRLWEWIRHQNPTETAAALACAHASDPHPLNIPVTTTSSRRQSLIEAHPGRKQPLPRANVNIQSMLALIQANHFLTVACQHFIDRLFRPSTNRAKYGLPDLTMDKVDRSLLLMTAVDVWFLHRHLPLEYQHPEWRLLYSSKRDGLAWVNLVQRIQHQGSTFIMIRSAPTSSSSSNSRPCLFGGFATDPWHLNPQFYGQPSCFLFQLDPQLRHHPATGYNTNYQYLQEGKQTLPNGLGMGGQWSYFGLYLDTDLMTGHTRGSPVNSTYGNAPFTGGEECFAVDQVDVWLVKPVKDPHGLGDTGRWKEGRQEILDFLSLASCPVPNEQSAS